MRAALLILSGRAPVRRATPREAGTDAFCTSRGWILPGGTEMRSQPGTAAKQSSSTSLLDEHAGRQEGRLLVTPGEVPDERGGRSALRCCCCPPSPSHGAPAAPHSLQPAPGQACFALSVQEGRSKGQPRYLIKATTFMLHDRGCTEAPVQTSRSAAGQRLPPRATRLQPTWLPGCCASRRFCFLPRQAPPASVCPGRCLPRRNAGAAPGPRALASAAPGRPSCELSEGAAAQPDRERPRAGGEKRGFLAGTAGDTHERAMRLLRARRAWAHVPVGGPAASSRCRRSVPARCRVLSGCVQRALVWQARAQP